MIKRNVGYIQMIMVHVYCIVYQMYAPITALMTHARMLNNVMMIQ